LKEKHKLQVFETEYSEKYLHLRRMEYVDRILNERGTS
jgi:hypothetical protein